MTDHGEPKCNNRVDAPVSASESEEAMQSETISVLVVEDEVLIRMGVVDDLEQAGFSVLEAGNTDEAMSILAAHPEVRAVFTDVELPGTMNGLRLAATVHELWPPIRIIVTSGRIRVGMRDLPDEALFMPKPYNNDEIVSTLRGLVAA
jgi:CheY-like chemotaxis protein